MIATALRTLILTSPACAALGLHEHGVTERAVFTQHPPPKDAPVCITIDETGAQPWDTRGRVGVESVALVRLKVEKSRSAVTSRAAAVQLWQTLHRGAVTISGWECLPVAAEFPHDAVDEDGYPAYEIRCTVNALKIV